MRSAQMSNEHVTQAPSAGTIDTTLEIVVIPVSDVDRTYRFYGSLQSQLATDFASDNTGSCNRAPWQAWRFGPDIEGRQTVERQDTLARYFFGRRSRTTQ